MLAERSVGSDRAPENDAGLCHGGGDDVRIVALLRGALVEEITVCAPRFQSRFHGGSGYRQIEETQRSQVGLEFSGHRSDQPFPFDSQRRALWDLPRRLTEHAMALSVPSFLKDVHALRNALKDWPANEPDADPAQAPAADARYAHRRAVQRPRLG